MGAPPGRAPRYGAPVPDAPEAGSVVVLDAKAISAQEERWAKEYGELVRRGTLVPEE